MKLLNEKCYLIAKTTVFLVLVPGLVAVLIPYFLVEKSLQSTGAKFIFELNMGLFPVLVGLFICLWCFWDFINKGKGTPSPFDPPKQLVTAGPYRYVRNPMYIGIILVVFGEAIMYSSVLLIFYLIFLLVFFHISVVYYEEPKLRSVFGENYHNYLISVPRWMATWK